MQLGVMATVVWCEWIVVVLSVFLCSTAQGAGEPSCKDDNGNSVDWFYASKLPKSKTMRNGWYRRNGLAYLYLLSSEPESSNWTLSSKGIDDPNSMFGRTLGDLYQMPRSQDLSYVLYNDREPHGTTDSRGGHMKGVLAFDEQGQGFWMLHSVPQYPNVEAGELYDYPVSGRIYGQSFLCISIGNSSNINAIGSQFKYAQPNVYEHFLQDWVEEGIPELWKSVINSEVIISSPWYNIVHLDSKGGSTFTYFAKHVRFNQDLYANLVAPTLKTNLWVETWRHGINKIPSVCRRYDVQNVKTVLIEPLSYSYANGQDHSKWAVSPTDSTNSTLPWFCSGDINRMESQFRRGGGTVCLSSLRVQNVYDASAVSIESCAADDE